MDSTAPQAPWGASLAIDVLRDRHRLERDGHGEMGLSLSLSQWWDTHEISGAPKTLAVAFRIRDGWLF